MIVAGYGAISGIGEGFSAQVVFYGNVDKLKNQLLRDVLVLNTIFPIFPTYYRLL